MHGLPVRVIVMLFVAGFATACAGFPGVEPYVIITDENVYMQDYIDIKKMYPYSAENPFRQGEKVTITGIYSHRGHYWYHALLRNGRTGFIDSTKAELGVVKNVPIIEAPSPDGENIWITDITFKTADSRSSCETLTPISITVQNTDLRVSREMTLRVQFYNRAGSTMLLEEAVYLLPVLEPMQTYEAVVSFSMHNKANGGYRVRADADYENKIQEVDEWDNDFEVRFNSACGNHP